MIYKNYLSALLLVTLLSSSYVIMAGQVSIKKTVFRLNGVSWSIDVTLKHTDTGWKHYADAWRVVDSNGNEFAKRTLFHPHVNEQPFTRSLSQVSIPKGITVVFIEAHDTVHKWSAKKLQVNLLDKNLRNVRVFR